MCIGVCCFCSKPGGGRVSTSGTINCSPDTSYMHFTRRWTIIMLELFAFFSPFFFTVLGNSPTCAAHQTRYSLLVSLR